jgi:hypothetical protein
LAGQTYARLRYGRIDKIFQAGLHEFISQIVDDGIALGRDVGEFYLLG